MRGLQKSKRVSWASDLNLCQVKLFLSDESPSLVGLGGQDHLQAKESWHSAGSGSDDNLPPGFESIQPPNAFQSKLSQIPLLHWKCPSKFVLDPMWQVAAGEESKELEFESQREMRVLEAVYPRPSAIPPNPASPMGDPYHNDHHTPIIPITPIEDEDMPPVTATSSSSTPAPTNNLPPPVTVPGVEADVVTAAYSALTAAMSNTTQGNLIDPNLLIKILGNPTLIEKLVSNHAPSSGGSSQPVSQPPPLTATIPPPEQPLPRPPHLPFSSPSSTGSHFPPPNRVGPVPVSSLAPQSEVSPAGKKDINYYKSLIQQHGGEKLENGNNNINNQKTRGDVKPKMTKACIYFNSTRGCRHGASCVFQHDSSSSTHQQQQQQRVISNSNSNLAEGQNAKRMKMDREITGT